MKPLTLLSGIAAALAISATAFATQITVDFESLEPVDPNDWPRFSVPAPLTIAGVQFSGPASFGVSAQAVMAEWMGPYYSFHDRVLTYGGERSPPGTWVQISVPGSLMSSLSIHDFGSIWLDFVTPLNEPRLEWRTSLHGVPVDDFSVTLAWMDSSAAQLFSNPPWPTGSLFDLFEIRITSLPFLPEINSIAIDEVTVTLATAATVPDAGSTMTLLAIALAAVASCHRLHVRDY